MLFNDRKSTHISEFRLSFLHLLTEMTKVTSIWRLFLQLIFQQKIYQYFVFYSADSIPNRRVTSHFNFFFQLKKSKLSIMFFKWFFIGLKDFQNARFLFFRNVDLLKNLSNCWNYFLCIDIIYLAYVTSCLSDDESSF